MVLSGNSSTIHHKLVLFASHIFPRHKGYLKKICQGICFFTSPDGISHHNQSWIMSCCGPIHKKKWATKKNKTALLSRWNTGCLIEILTMLCYNHHITVVWSSIYPKQPPTKPRTFHCSSDDSWWNSYRAARPTGGREVPSKYQRLWSWLLSSCYFVMAESVQKWPQKWRLFKVCSCSLEEAWWPEMRWWHCWWKKSHSQPPGM